MRGGQAVVRRAQQLTPEFLQPRPQYREDSEEETDNDDDDDNDEDYGGRRRGIDHASRPKRAAAKQAEQQLKAASVSLQSSHAIPHTAEMFNVDSHNVLCEEQKRSWRWICIVMRPDHTQYDMFPTALICSQ